MFLKEEPRQKATSEMGQSSSRLFDLCIFDEIDFCFFLGDLNYRLETTFADLNNTNVKEQAILMVPTKD